MMIRNHSGPKTHIISIKCAFQPRTLIGITLLLLGSGLFCGVYAQFGDDVRIRGYVQGMPVRIAAEIPEPESPLPDGGFTGITPGDQVWWEYRLQNRLNLRWYATQELTFTWEMRTRLFAGDLVRDIPGYAEGIDVDDGFFDLSWMIAEEDDWLLHYIPDRFYGEWSSGDWSVRVGRQRVNWGINTMTNPNDLFNIYSFYDFDYPERPGSDAIRVQRFTGFASRMEFAVSPGRDLENSVAAALYAFNTRGYDIQFIGGYYRERFATGGGWAGSIGNMGFKGESMFFVDLDDDDSGSRATNLIASVSADYMFGSGVFLIGEFLYNKEGGRDQFHLMAETLSPDNPSFSRYQLTSQATYDFSPILNGALSAVWYPDESALFLSPSLTWSVMTDLDFNILGQVFVAGDDSAFGNAGNVAAASLRYNF